VQEGIDGARTQAISVVRELFDDRQTKDRPRGGVMEYVQPHEARKEIPTHSARLSVSIDSWRSICDSIDSCRSILIHRVSSIESHRSSTIAHRSHFIVFRSS
jgi:hypothetical protein